MVKIRNNNLFTHPLTDRPHKFLLIALLALAVAGPATADDARVPEENSRRAEALAFNCFTCHGTDGHSPGAMKSLNKLSATEIRDKLMAFRRDENDPTIMNRIARGYSDDEIAIIADYIANLE